MIVYGKKISEDKENAVMGKNLAAGLNSIVKTVEKAEAKAAKKTRRKKGVSTDGECTDDSDSIPTVIGKHYKKGRRADGRIAA